MKELSKIALAVEPSTTMAIDAMFKQMKAEGQNVIGFGAGGPGKMRGFFHPGGPRVSDSGPLRPVFFPIRAAKKDDAESPAPSLAYLFVFFMKSITAYRKRPPARHGPTPRQGPA